MKAEDHLTPKDRAVLRKIAAGLTLSFVLEVLIIITLASEYS